MRGAHKRQLIAFLAATILLVAVLLVWRSQHHIIPPHEVPEQRRKIERLTGDLKKESWEQSISSLLTNESQFFSVYGHNDLSAELELEDTLSARRSIKILNELQAMPMAERVRTCTELFNRAMRTWEEGAFMIMQVNDDPSLVSEHKGSPYSYHPRHLLCLAMFATAETGRREIVRAQFERLDQYQRKIESRIAESNFPDFDRKFMLKTLMPQARSLVNVLRLAVSKDPNASELLSKVDAYCGSIGMTTNQLTIVPWNARTTSFEPLVGSPVDTSKGVTTYVLYDWGSDMRNLTSIFEKDESKRVALQRLRELVL